MAGYCHCASIISGDASLHLPWVAPEVTLRSMFKGEQFHQGDPLAQVAEPHVGFDSWLYFCQAPQFPACCAALGVSCSCAEQGLQALILAQVTEGSSSLSAGCSLQILQEAEDKLHEINLTNHGNSGKGSGPVRLSHVVILVCIDSSWNISHAIYQSQGKNLFTSKKNK